MELVWWSESFKRYRSISGVIVWEPETDLLLTVRTKTVRGDNTIRTDGRDDSEQWTSIVSEQSKLIVERSSVPRKIRLRILLAKPSVLNDGRSFVLVNGSSVHKHFHCNEKKAY